ncbi:DUF1223 domain-containing protein [Mesobacterium sp. TK19101]|uniref:DUF1223 domain-containing protein n=1 Tax=Mesobacterium hydrothermale TaxID=3111907 RepID=A0ABU6HLF6_9RHOB|nr:DUF1223 domain-containing protein [Mesobacterium sp. TK19101]MEC3862283.1 DUF1223 domain-containing protein [Mesobacterium sp. TK19101]
MDMRQLLKCCAVISLVLAGSAQADSDPVVVELFTSQGCSSCPPADQLLMELGDRDDVIPLALHIDYWDYIGWKDIFAQPIFTKRQKAYARSAGRTMIYTPQMIVGGEEDIVGNRPMELADLIAKHKANPSPVGLTITRQGDDLHIVANAKQPLGPVDIHLVRYDPQQTVTINRGENSGLTTTYTNIVTDWQRLEPWDGQGTLDRVAQISGDAPVVVLVQKASYGSILAAARLR